jgi:hypothetical protein
MLRLGERLPSHLPTIPMQLCSDSKQPGICWPHTPGYQSPSSREHPLIGASEEAGEDGHGKHLPKDLHVIRPHHAHLLSLVCWCSRFLLFLLQSQRSGAIPRRPLRAAAPAGSSMSGRPATRAALGLPSLARGGAAPTPPPASPRDTVCSNSGGREGCAWSLSFPYRCPVSYVLGTVRDASCAHQGSR